MRVGASIQVSASADAVWAFIADPSRYLHFMSGITRWEVESEEATGLGARYRMLMRVRSAEIGGLVEVVEWEESRDMAGHLPLPAKITVQVLEPIDLEEEFGEDPDLDEAYEAVLGRMQRTLDDLAAARRLPVIG